MPYKLTLKDFVEKSTQLHKGRYDYSEAVYKNVQSKVAIICPVHGIFLQAPRCHLAGQGCPKCSSEIKSKNNTISHDEFIIRSRKVHGDKYSYPEAYKGIQTKITIVCPDHGPFKQTPASHWGGHGCRKCANTIISNALSKKDLFLKRAIEVHGNFYDYSQSNYINGATPVLIICPKHGGFYQQPRMHINGQGCPECGKWKGRANLNHEIFIQKARAIHGNRYEYPDLYKNSNLQLKIICPEHGAFLQRPSYHWRGGGCPKCGNKKKGAPWGFKEFLKKAEDVHGNKYTYDESTFTRMRDKIRINCPIHGDFWQICQMHIYGQGCPSCGNTLSKGEKEIGDWLQELGYTTESRNRSVLPSGKELDIYLPDYKTAIEYNGLYWHSSRATDDISIAKKRHIQKLEECRIQGIRLLQFWDFEWNDKKDICKEIILFTLGKIDKRIYARNCTIRHLDTKEANLFLDANHIQGRCKSNVRLGIFMRDELVGIQCYQAPNPGGASGKNWLLIRTAFLKRTQVIGGISKLFKAFINEINPVCVVDYTDRRMFVASGHPQMGFVFEKITNPCSYLTNGIKLFSRRYYRYKKKPFKQEMPWDDALTDTENLANNGWWWVWDCGKIKNVWKPPIT
jgi:hypothetical protein